jgi:hypothetical protein
VTQIFLAMEQFREEQSRSREDREAREADKGETMVEVFWRMCFARGSSDL